MRNQYYEALFKAIRTDDVEKLKNVLKKNPEAGLKTLSKYGHTAEEYILKKGALNVWGYFVEKEGTGWCEGRLISAVRNGQFELVKKALPLLSLNELQKVNDQTIDNLQRWNLAKEEEIVEFVLEYCPYMNVSKEKIVELEKRKIKSLL